MVTKGEGQADRRVLRSGEVSAAAPLAPASQFGVEKLDIHRLRLTLSAPLTVFGQARLVTLNLAEGDAKVQVASLTSPPIMR